MVLAVMALIGKMTVCLYVRHTKKMDEPLIVIGSAMATLASFIETPSRISEMALYVMPRFFDAI